ncbi:MAG TPA: T9SS type A sorting domain-containing protein, partial [Chitinophagales bacterium]|nr:T9SS type A sorting domain-containing protein [Chitinophagales bacterium]
EPIRLGLTAATTPATCGANNGTVDLSVTGGTGTLSYFWSNGATTQDLSGVAAGTYFVIVSDANGCSSSASAQVTTPNGLTVNLGANGIDNISCNGLTNGAIDIAISGGTTPYNVLWSNGATTQDLSGLSAGDYEVTVTDASGCSAILFATITEPTALNASTAITPEICGDGAINLSVGGGTINYSYNWSNGASTQDISNLNAGTYTVTVTDANGCTVISTANVNQTPLPANNDGPACEQGTITIGFGTAGEVGEVINYVWSGPNGYSNSGSFVSDGSDIITADLNNLSLQDAGLYSVTVTFANGCTRTANTLVKVNGLPIISDIITTCNGTIATITVIASSNPNGNAVEYSIDGINYQTSNVFTGVVNGSYKIYVRDVVTGCVTETDITVNCVACPIPVASNSGPACVGQPLSLSVNPNLPTGVTATYLWTKQGSTATSTAQNPNLGSATIGKAGTYVVQVTYSNGCVATASTIVVVNPLPTATASVVCNGTTGTITVTANAGGAAIVYSLTGAPGTFQTGNVFTNVPNGTYNIVVRNNTTGCTRTVPVTVNCNACPVAVAANSGPVCPGSSLSLTVNPNLPTGVTATYAWSGPAGTSTLQNPTIPNMTPAKAGIYTTTVTYSNGCTSVASTNVVVSPKPTVNAIASCDPATGGIITITATGGSGFTYNWNGNSQDSNVFTSVPNGNGYVVTVTNSAGCSGTASVTVSCVTCQAAVGAVTITSGGCSGEQISATGIFNSPSTGYANYLLLTDAQGNILEVQAAPSATFAYSAMGGVTYNVYAYSVKTPNGGPNPPAVGSNVSAISGSCFDLSDGTQYDNIVPAPPMFDSSLNTQEGNNGGITPFEYNTDIITVEGGTLPYDFVWDNTGYVRYDIVYSDNVDANGDGSTMPGAIITIYYTDDAQWNVTITDQSGCAENEVLSTNSFNSGANAILDIDAFETFSCSDINGADGSIELTITGGDTGCGEFQYEWFGPEGWDGVASGLTATGNGSFVGTSSAPINNYTLTNLPTGWYSVVITDCAGNVTEGWYWVPLGTRGRAKVDATALLSVQPNPFANQTQVTFTTEGATQATVMVYTVDGKLVSTLFKGAVQDKQTYSVPFDGANLPTGVYMIQMVTDNDISKFEKVIIAR